MIPVALCTLVFDVTFEAGDEKRFPRVECVQPCIMIPYDMQLGTSLDRAEPGPGEH